MLVLNQNLPIQRKLLSVENNKITRKITLILIKYIPAMQMAGMLVNNTLYYIGINFANNILDIILGNSLLFTILQLSCSYTFKFCVYHRAIIIANLINIIIAYFDTIVSRPVEGYMLLAFYYIVYSVAIISITINHLNRKRYESKIKNIKRIATRKHK